ncbi:acetamidase/formamidase family protein [Meiothermus hypogaeus]|uniref:Amidase n=3 Tax=Meiothermus hypogaeus TaxID=884155 RepID=A0A511R122_9DEIN|nr:acetamidase/formamidase family protein [Meiothermus hypogaeus]RIH81075.1 Acetamidase [Meiothermus hypogaeus]GEM83301.1 amidase [Meiothermus hypogaeus NBRC 106114]
MGTMSTHTFEPTHYHHTLGNHPPVLRIAPGDTVITTCVDAGGLDRYLQQVTPRGNPMTGPFFVEGAQVGDTLAVRLEKLRPNRTSGWSGVVLASNVVDPDDVPILAQARGSQRWLDWEVDLRANTARLRSPAGPLEGFELSLEPMLGCFGVAPGRGEAISTATSGPHGGNMDYRGFKEGVTVYFPVLVEGALFFLGDGHALQGDGEIAGTGIEISMDVQFSVDLIKGQAIRWPRGENAAYIFTVGNARPLDQCVQHATSEMLRWLTSQYRLDTQSASQLLGQCVRYDLGNIFDPAYTMICKMPKKVLERLSSSQ